MADTLTDAEFDMIATAISLAAGRALLDLQADEYKCCAIGLFPATTEYVLQPRQTQVDLLAKAHRYFKAMASIESEVKALIARKMMETQSGNGHHKTAAGGLEPASDPCRWFG